MRDKDLGEIAATLFPAAHRLILTRPANPRAATLDTLEPLAASLVAQVSPISAPTPAEALRAAEASTPGEGIICVTGSLYLVGEVKSLSARREQG
jgi:dihydrofolate synthase/folylpolyglutamate synthase